ncbi:hypothetical protein NHF46_19635 [Arthrobacter alpinus]|nr:hypothetical protein [Arthrobacter alpinus]
MPPRDAIGETTRNTAAAALAASVLCPDGSEFNASVGTPRSGRSGRPALIS